MSGTIPPPPQGLPPPPRSVRALRIGAILVILFVVGTGIAGIVWWSLHSLGEQPGSKVIATTQGTGQGVSMAHARQGDFPAPLADATGASRHKRAVPWHALIR